MLALARSELQTVADALAQARDLLTSTSDDDFCSMQERHKAAASILDEQIVTLTNMQSLLPVQNVSGHRNVS